MKSWLSPWRWERVGVPVTSGIDEMALAFTADTNGRTWVSTAVATARAPGPVVGRRGLTFLPKATSDANVDRVEEVPGGDVPSAQSLDRALARIAEVHGEPTASFVALQLEYRWP